MAFDYVTNVRVDGTGYPYPGGAAAYEREMRGILDTVNSTRTGRTMLGFFALRSRMVTIVPVNLNARGELANQTPDADHIGAFGGGTASNPQNSFRRGTMVRDWHGTAYPQLPRGTGRGSANFVSFTPLHFAARANAPVDCVLVHELFHAMRAQFGMTENRPLGGEFDSIEELFAILVENMHRVERGIEPRANHRRDQHMSPNHSMAANPSFHEPMRRLSDMMPTIVNALARIDLSYNPFQDWLAYRRAHPHAGRHGPSP